MEKRLGKYYIRTKDGVYENKPIEKHLGRKRGKGFEITFRKEAIIKEADTIEELCDEFVAVNDDMDLPLLDSLENICLLLTSKNHMNDIVYGAIWTDKGLIYVAKMKNGELVLL